VPDALAAALGRGGADGKLVIIKKGGDAFAVKEWLAADAHARTTADSRTAGRLRSSVGADARSKYGIVVDD